MGKGDYYYYGEQCLLKEDCCIVKVIHSYKKINGYRFYEIEHKDGSIEIVSDKDLEKL